MTMKSTNTSKIRLAVRTVVFGCLVATPVLAKPPHAPDDQYEAFDKDTATIKDFQTKLAWERNISTTPITQASAASYCSLSWDPGGGRLPTIKELLTLFDEEPHTEYNGQNIVVHIDIDAFGANRTPVDLPYWSQTPELEEGTNRPTGNVWVLNFANGAMTTVSRTQMAHYRCVRG